MNGGETDSFEALLTAVLEAESHTRRYGVESARHSKHAYRLVWRGVFVGWRSYTKSHLTAAERRRALKAQRRARKAGRS